MKHEHQPLFGVAETKTFCSFYRCIRRVVFYSLIKPTVNEKGEKEMNTISVSQALQIAGRAGRYGTQHKKVCL
jgi:hypothetical protein